MQESATTQAPARARGWGERETPYSVWRRNEGVPIYTGSHVEDLHTVVVAPWPRLGQRGAIVTLAAQEVTDGWLVEIAPGEQTEPIRHLFECSYYVLDGHGATTVSQAGSAHKHTVEWQKGSLFSIPINCTYQHFNHDSQRPTRLFTPTTAPLLMNAVRNAEFVFNCDYRFTDRYNESDDYFTDPPRKIDTREWQTNFLPDVRTVALDERRERGAGNLLFFWMAGNAMHLHISEFPPGTYKKAHRHGPGAEIIIVGGTGYSLLWFPGTRERVKVDWHDGSIISPMGGQYHQHFNTGATPVRYLAYTFGAVVVNDTRDGGEGASMSEREGGWQIEYEDEDPEIFATFAQECVRHGAAVALDHPLRRGTAS
jgi:quercetin dioxygenase-like cupin family protein